MYQYEVNSSYDVAVMLWITSFHKNRMTTRVITLLRVHVTSLTTYNAHLFIVLFNFYGKILSFYDIFSPKIVINIKLIHHMTLLLFCG